MTRSHFFVVEVLGYLAGVTAVVRPRQVIPEQFLDNSGVVLGRGSARDARRGQFVADQQKLR